MSAIGDLVVNLVTKTQQFTRPLTGAISTVTGFAQRVNGIVGSISRPFAGVLGSMSSVVSRMIPLSAALGGIAGGLSFIGGLGWGVSLAVEAEQAQVAFTTMLGSATQAKTLLGQLSQFAATTPYESPEVTAAGKQLLAYGVAAGDIIPTLRMLGDVASGVGAPLGDIAYLFGTAKTQGRLFAADINQFTNRGIPIIKALAETMGVAENAVKGMVTAGQIGFPEMQAAFQYLTKDGSQFGGMMAAQSQTIGGLWSTLKDNLGLTLRSISESFMEAFGTKDLMGNAIAGLESVKAGAIALGPHITEVGRIARAMFDTLGSGAQATLAAVSSVFGMSTAEWSELLLDVLRVGRVVMENFTTIISASMLSAAAAVVGFAGQFEHFFTGTVPALLLWFSQNWQAVFQTAANFVGTVFQNLFTNLKSGFGALWEWIQGGFQGDLQFDWTPLMQGFESAVQDLPNLPAREISALEQNLTESAAGLWEKIDSAFAGLADEKLKGLSVPELPATIEKLPVGPTSGDSTSQQGKENKPNFAAALTKGSAEAISAINRAAFGSSDSSHEKKVEKLQTKQVALQEKMLEALEKKPEIEERVADF